MNIESVFVKDFYYTKEADTSFLPPLIRRKLGSLDKFAISAMESVYSKEIEEIIFASKNGEVDRLDKIISQYKEMNEVSPAQFSASVHNYPVGFFTLYKKINIPYFALAAGDKTFKNGLIAASISAHKNVLYVYAEKNFALSCLISKTEGEIELSNIPETATELIKMLESKK